MSGRLPPPESCRRIRERAGVSQEALARRLGVSAGTMSLLENGKRRPRGELERRYGELLLELVVEAAARG